MLSEVRLFDKLPQMSTTRYILQITDGGEFILVGDGFAGEARKYQIAGDDVPTVAQWLPSSKVEIRPSSSKYFSARICIVAGNVCVKAVPLGLVPYSLFN